jgi:hypothetical protein
VGYWGKHTPQPWEERAIVLRKIYFSWLLRQSYKRIAVEYSQTAILRPSKAALAAQCFAFFLLSQYASQKNLSVVTTTEKPKPPHGLDASEYLGWLILFF